MQASAIDLMYFSDWFEEYACIRLNWLITFPRTIFTPQIHLFTYDSLLKLVELNCSFTAARMRLAANEKAEAEKIVQIKKAEGEAESKYLAGVGIARQRQAIVDGLRDSVLAFSENVPGTTAKDIMDMVLVTQYFDTMKEIGASSKSSSVFIPHGPGAVKDVAAQIRDGLLQSNMH
jgi:hypothetical protein